jgi:protein gp37
MNKTSISLAMDKWNPVTGCMRISVGYRNPFHPAQ